MNMIKVILATLILAGAGGLAYACGHGKEDGMKDGMMMKHRMGMMGHKMGMMNASMVSSKDGGVIVMIGNKLIKYDKNLKVVKEVELDTGMNDKGGCPMCGMGKHKEEGHETDKEMK